MRSLIVAIGLILSVALWGNPVEDMKGRGVDTSVLQFNGEAWFQIPLEAQAIFIAGFLASTNGLAFMLETTGRTFHYKDEARWLEIRENVGDLTRYVSMWYAQTEMFETPVFIVIYHVVEKLLWDDQDVKKLNGETTTKDKI